MSDRYIHNPRCPVRGFHSDAAKRIADTYTMHRLADLYGHIGKWMACRLDDGTSDNCLYESRRQAIFYQKNYENFYTFIQIVPAQITQCEAEIMITVARRIYDAGGRISDGYSRHELIKRLGWEDQIALSKGIVTNVQFGREK